MTAQFIWEGHTKMCLRQCARLVVLSGVLSASTVGLSGCLSMGSVQTASTLGKGNFQISAEPGIYGPNFGPPMGTGGGGGGGGMGGGTPSGSEAVPHFDVAFRYGITDRFDIGVRTGWSLFELQTKFLLTPPDAQTLAISTAPAVGVGLSSVGGTTVTYFNVAIPLLVGIKHFRANELIFGVRYNNMVFALGDSTGSAVVYLGGVGGSVGYQFAIGEIFRILPELAINVPIFTSSRIGAIAIDGAGFGGVIWQLKVGLIFGRTAKKAEPIDIGPPPPMPAPEPMPVPAPLPEGPPPEPTPAPLPPPDPVPTL